MKKKIIESFVSLLVEKGGVKKDSVIKFYTPELMLRDKKAKVEYEVSEIDVDENLDNPLFKIFRFDLDGNRVEVTKTTDEILKDFEHV